MAAQLPNTQQQIAGLVQRGQALSPQPAATPPIQFDKPGARAWLFQVRVFAKHFLGTEHPYFPRIKREIMLALKLADKDFVESALQPVLRLLQAMELDYQQNRLPAPQLPYDPDSKAYEKMFDGVDKTTNTLISLSSGAIALMVFKDLKWWDLQTGFALASVVCSGLSILFGLFVLLTMLRVLDEDADLRQAVIEPQTMNLVISQHVFFGLGIVLILAFWLGAGKPISPSSQATKSPTVTSP
ncbi:MAG: hypothetical protein K2X29_14885 [Candidatus Obscuribacterales bacterium]|nr:hypothetical protein [Candidatus Obscuribacterales bacterium]